MSAQTEYYARYKKAGLCTRCGKRAPEAGRTVCAECLDKMAVSRSGQARRRHKRNLSGATHEIMQRCPASADIKACLNCKRRRYVFDTDDERRAG